MGLDEGTVWTMGIDDSGQVIAAIVGPQPVLRVWGDDGRRGGDIPLPADVVPGALVRSLDGDIVVGLATEARRPFAEVLRVSPEGHVKKHCQWREPRTLERWRSTNRGAASIAVSLSGTVMVGGQDGTLVVFDAQCNAHVLHGPQCCSEGGDWQQVRSAEPGFMAQQNHGPVSVWMPGQVWHRADVLHESLSCNRLGRGRRFSWTVGGATMLADDLVSGLINELETSPSCEWAVASDRHGIVRCHRQVCERLP